MDQIPYQIIHGQHPGRLSEMPEYRHRFLKLLVAGMQEMSQHSPDWGVPTQDLWDIVTKQIYHDAEFLRGLEAAKFVSGYEDQFKLRPDQDMDPGEMIDAIAFCSTWAFPIAAYKQEPETGEIISFYPLDKAKGTPLEHIVGVTMGPINGNIFAAPDACHEANTRNLTSILMKGLIPSATLDSNRISYDGERGKNTVEMWAKDPLLQDYKTRFYKNTKPASTKETFWSQMSIMTMQ